MHHSLMSQVSVTDTRTWLQVFKERLACPEEEIEFDFNVHVMPAEGKSDRNSGNVRLVFNLEKHWPSRTLGRMGLHRSVHAIKATRLMAYYLAGYHRAHSLIYKTPAEMVADLAIFEVPPEQIQEILDKTKKYFKP